MRSGQQEAAMWLVAMAVTAAHAGPAVSVTLGGGVPLATETASTPGPVVGLLGGYRVKAGPVAVQPELAARWNFEPGTISLGVGGEITVGMGLFRIGPYAHIGMGLVPNPGPSPDAGLAIGIDPPSPLIVGVRVGWAYEQPGLYKCGNCPQPAQHWAVASAVAGVAF